MLQTMKLSGSDTYAMSVMYFRWALLERRLRRLGESFPELRTDCDNALQTITDVYDAYYQTEEYSEEHVE